MLVCETCTKEYPNIPKAHKKQCNPCYQKDYYRKDKQRRLELNRAWRKRNPQKRSEQSWAENKMSKYGLTKEQVLSMYASQNQACSICGVVKHIRGKYGLYVDHDHATGKVRELLCQKCNGGLGQFNDNPALLEKASLYLRKHGK